MAASSKDKKIWVKYHNNVEDPEKHELKEIIIRDEIVSKALKQVLLDAFGISQDNLVVKLRNSRESLVPINSLLAPNSPGWPYTLEVCKHYNQVKPRPRTVSVPTFQQLLRRRLTNIDHRLLKLEQTISELPEIQGNILKKECKELEEKMNFLIARIKDADDFQWKGMFQRNPLW